MVIPFFPRGREGTSGTVLFNVEHFVTTDGSHLYGNPPKSNATPTETT
jgi:hypothetical protein